MKKKKTTAAPIPSEQLVKPAFTRALAAEIVKNLTSIGRFTTRPFRHDEAKNEEIKVEELGQYPILVDTSVFIDGRILPIVNSGFLTGTLIIPRFILSELQHIADSEDSLRRAKGRRGLDIVNKLKGQKVNLLLQVKFVSSDPQDIKEVDHKLVELARRWSSQKPRLLTVDFNLAHVARAQGVKILNVHDIAQALKVSLMPGEEFTVRVTHEGKERAQGVGYLPDGTMVVVDEARDRVGQDILVIVTKVHQTPAGQLFFARIK
ncbi:MAG: PilT protein domain-containing protein [Microgenomates group bacterium GW2011_GWC1_49_7]|nr:MAG: PilT protein domain-containing protein [Microgenomates group bacterium GW2011_GWC1_49_7]